MNVPEVHGAKRGKKGYGVHSRKGRRGEERRGEEGRVIQYRSKTSADGLLKQVQCAGYRAYEPVSIMLHKAAAVLAVI
jgi:hypothetical protein